MHENPYQSPNTQETANRPDFGGTSQLAGRFTRFAAVMVDGFLMAAVLVPIQFLTGFFERAMRAQVGPVEQIGMSLLGLATMLVLNGYLLYSRGQTIGKLLTKIQIVDSQNHKLLSFFRVYVLRYLWTLPITIIVALVPGTTDDLALNLIVWIDALLIFGVARRCLHDYIAGSSVVLYREGRGRAAG
ncbi:MAG: RDD family protein [Planctomycetota bacterium]